MAPRSILVLYNEPVLPRDHPDAESEHSVIEVAAEVAGSLEKAGQHVSQLGLGRDPRVLWSVLQERRPDVVFNLYEGCADDPRTESYVAGLLEWSEIPFTGSLSSALNLARAKHTTKYLLQGAGLPTAPFMLDSVAPPQGCRIAFPVIVKPAEQDGSVGLDQESVCTSQAQVEARVRYLLKSYGPPVLIEEYIPGREFNVALIELPELIALPPTEIPLPGANEARWPILTYQGKWTAGAPMYGATAPRYPTDLCPQTVNTLSRLAMDAFRLVGCRDYARVDFRMKPSGELFILEVNPNPEISSSAGFACGLGAANRTYEEFILDLVRQAHSRRPL